MHYVTMMDYNKDMTLNKSLTYTPKEALHHDPDWTATVTLGRGRMPKGGDEHCRALAAQGYRIKGYDVQSSTSTPATGEPVEPKVVRVAASNEKVVQEYTILYDERMYKAIDSNGKEYGMREVCNKCRVSLVQNHCENPQIVGGVNVQIVPK